MYVLRLRWLHVWIKVEVVTCMHQGWGGYMYASRLRWLHVCIKVEVVTCMYQG